MTISRLQLTSDPLMKQMPFPDTNYGMQNKQKQTLKPIIIRPLIQTRWREEGAYQLFEVITKFQTIFHPPGFFVSDSFSLSNHTLFFPVGTSDDGTVWLTAIKWIHIAAWELSFLALFWSLTFLPALHSTLSTWSVSTWLISSTCSLWVVPARNRST